MACIQFWSQEYYPKFGERDFKLLSQSLDFDPGSYLSFNEVSNSLSSLSSFRDLEVWQTSMRLVELVYGITRKLPVDERFGLKSQMQRAAVSIPSNIAEGYGLGAAGYRHHVMIARGSLMELEVQLELVVRLKLINCDDVAACWPLVQRVGQMLTRLALSLAKPR